MRKYKTSEPWIGVHSSTLFGEDFLKLSDKAKVLYLMLKASRKRDGGIILPYRQIYKWPGWKNMNIIARTFKELEENQWIRRRKAGGLLKNANIYELTFLKDNFGIKTAR